MEPLHPDLRAALKQTHPDLTDEDIDRTEELLVQRMLHDPEKEAHVIAQLDRERTELIQRKMPRYTEVVQAFRVRQAESSAKATPKVTVILKKPKQ